MQQFLFNLQTTTSSNLGRRFFSGSTWPEVTPQRAGGAGRSAVQLTSGTRRVRSRRGSHCRCGRFLHPGIFRASILVLPKCPDPKQEVSAMEPSGPGHGRSAPPAARPLPARRLRSYLAGSGLGGLVPTRAAPLRGLGGAESAEQAGRGRWRRSCAGTPGRARAGVVPGRLSSVSRRAEPDPRPLGGSVPAVAFAAGPHPPLPPVLSAGSWGGRAELRDQTPLLALRGLPAR